MRFFYDYTRNPNNNNQKHVKVNVYHHFDCLHLCRGRRCGPGRAEQHRAARPQARPGQGRTGLPPRKGQQDAPAQSRVAIAQAEAGQRYAGFFGGAGGSLPAELVGLTFSAGF